MKRSTYQDEGSVEFQFEYEDEYQNFADDCVSWMSEHIRLPGINDPQIRTLLYLVRTIRAEIGSL
jgi:hypothetical protein